MTVKELIEALQKMPQEAKVEIHREGYALSEGDFDPIVPEIDHDGVVQL